MLRDMFTYSMTVKNIEKKDLDQLYNMMLRPDILDGALSAKFAEEKTGRMEVDFGISGVDDYILEIDRGKVEEAMHTLATSFPDAKFLLYAENLDASPDAYNICTFGDLFQESTMQLHMPELSPPVPFEQRYEAPYRRDFLTEFLDKTDFDLLYQQKMKLLEALDLENIGLGIGPVSKDTLEGLVNFLDLIGDWAEHEGRFQYPEVEEYPLYKPEPAEQKAPLDQIISSASERTTPSHNGQNKDREIE